MTSIPRGFKLNLDQGGRLMVILPTVVDGNAALQQQYFENVDKLERGQFGLKRHGMLTVDQTHGHCTNTPRVIALMSFPSRERELAFMDQPGWSSVKQSRKNIWKELVVNGISLRTPTAWSFSPECVYAFEFTWLNGAASHNAETLGYEYQGKTIGHLIPDTYESLADGNTPPTLITIVQWNSQAVARSAFSDRRFESYMSRLKETSYRHEIYVVRA